MEEIKVAWSKIPEHLKKYFEKKVENVSHYAAFPQRLILELISGGCALEVCKYCGLPRTRVTKPTEEYKKYLGSWTQDTDKSKELRAEIGFQANTKKATLTASYETIGWTDCQCEGEDKYQPGIVLDPFGGAMTTPLTARKLNRDFIAIELNSKYCRLGLRRLERELGRIFDSFDLGGEEDEV